MTELNRVLRANWSVAVRSIFFDLTLPPRLSLGAEPCEPARKSSNSLARHLSAARNADLAEPILREATRRFPSDPDAYVNPVKVLYRMGKTEEARAVYDQSLARFPDHSPTRKLGRGL